MNNDNDDNPHLKLASLGVEMWNRWARTKMHENYIDSLNLTNDEKNKFSSLKPFDEKEQIVLANTLNLKSLSELDIDVFCNGYISVNDFSGFYFPGIVNFSRATFCNKVTFSEARFIKDVYFTITTFKGDAEFYGVNYLDEVDFGRAKFERNAYFTKSIFNNVAEFSNVVISGNAYFEDSSFCKSAIFSTSRFVEIINFKNVSFSDDVCFDQSSRFSGHAFFNNATFNRKANFSKAIFNNRMFFTNTIFNGHTNFDEVEFNNNHAIFVDTKFNSSTSFIKAIFEYPPLFHKADIHQDTSFYQARYTKKDGSENCIRAWRTLKLAMNKIHDHENELLYFTYELDAKRAILKIENKLLSWINWFLISCYKKSSNYGTNILIPLGWLILLFFIFAFLYSSFWICKCNLSNYEYYSRGLQLSFANILPFSPISKGIMSSILGNDVHFGLQFVTTLQNIISIILLFLIGLAFKHKLSIK